MKVTTIFPMRIFACTILLVATVSSCKKQKIVIPDSPIFSKTAFASAATTRVFNRSNLIKRVVADTLSELAPGIKQTVINYIDYADKPMRLFIIEADLANPKVAIKAATPNNANQYGKQILTDMARAQVLAGENVVAAINGDYFNATTGEPQSILYKNGTAVKQMYKLCALCTYLSINNQGIPQIGAKDRPVDSTTIKDAVGGYHLLVRDSLKVSQGDLSIEPRTGVGVSSNNMVYFLVIDGRSASYSNGMSFSQMSDVFIALGVKDAINLDGGGSTTLVIKDGANLSVKNNPSDGTQRPVANALTVISK